MTMGPGEGKLNHATQLLKQVDQDQKMGMSPEVRVANALGVIAHALVGIGEMLSDARRQDVEETEAYLQRLAERDGK